MRRYLPWVIGAVAFLGYFAVFETLGFVEPDKYATLSYTVSNLAAHWPLATFLFGFVSGGLAVHFFWPWKGNPLGEGGG